MVLIKYHSWADPKSWLRPPEASTWTHSSTRSRWRASRFPRRLSSCLQFRVSLNGNLNFLKTMTRSARIRPWENWPGPYHRLQTSSAARSSSTLTSISTTCQVDCPVPTPTLVVALTTWHLTSMLQAPTLLWIALAPPTPLADFNTIKDSHQRSTTFHRARSPPQTLSTSISTPCKFLILTFPSPGRSSRTSRLATGQPIGKAGLINRSNRLNTESAKLELASVTTDPLKALILTSTGL